MKSSRHARIHGLRNTALARCARSRRPAADPPKRTAALRPGRRVCNRQNPMTRCIQDLKKYSRSDPIRGSGAHHACNVASCACDPSDCSSLLTRMYPMARRGSFRLPGTEVVRSDVVAIASNGCNRGLRPCRAFDKGRCLSAVRPRSLCLVRRARWAGQRIKPSSLSYAVKRRGSGPRVKCWKPSGGD
jgi:hypothetical protein